MQRALIKPEELSRTGSTRREGSSAYPLQVLVAEDNPVNQKLAVVLLEKAGHRVVLAEHGAAAVARWREGNFDLIFMDIQMPELDGLEATRKIREEELARGGHIPIVAMTAHAMTEDRENCLQAGMDDHLSKPLQRQELLGVLARVGAKAGQAACAAQPGKGVANMNNSNELGSSEVFDKAELVDRLEGDQDLLRELIEAFLAEADPLVQQVSEAVAKRDASDLHRAAHKLKGTVSTLGGKSATRVAMALETMGRSGELKDSEAALEQLRREMAALKKCLAELVEQTCPKS
jgi:CheY-like chemotaxis protein